MNTQVERGTMLKDAMLDLHNRALSAVDDGHAKLLRPGQQFLFYCEAGNVGLNPSWQAKLRETGIGVRISTQSALEATSKGEQRFVQHIREIASTFPQGLVEDAYRI